MTPPTKAMRHQGDCHSSDISCYDSVRFVSLLRDNELGSEEATLLRDHIANCPRCQIAKIQFEKMFQGLDELFAPVPPEEPN